MEEEDHTTRGLQSLLGLYCNTAKSLAVSVSIAACLPQPQFCSLQNSLKRLVLRPAHYEEESQARLVNINLAEAYVWQGSDCDAAVP